VVVQVVVVVQVWEVMSRPGEVAVPAGGGGQVAGIRRHITAPGSGKHGPGPAFEVITAVRA
jgi:hypothetical protein